MPRVQLCSSTGISIAKVPDITHNTTAELWACCGVDSTGKSSCSNPTDKTFQAPDPDQLRKIRAGVYGTDITYDIVLKSFTHRQTDILKRECSHASSEPVCLGWSFYG